MSCMEIICVSWCFYYVLKYVALPPRFNNSIILKTKYLCFYKKQCFFCFKQDK